jgi:acyl-CoA thioesterase
VSAYDLRYVDGGIPTPDTGPSADSRTTLWVRDEPARPLDHVALTAMADCFYPRAFRRQGGFVPAGTVTLSVHFLADAAEIAAHGTGHLLGTAFSRRFGRGYFDQTGELWTRDGRLLATSHQLVYFKA